MDDARRTRRTERVRRTERTSLRDGGTSVVEPAWAQRRVETSRGVVDERAGEELSRANPCTDPFASRSSSHQCRGRQTGRQSQAPPGHIPDMVVRIQEAAAIAGPGDGRISYFIRPATISSGIRGGRARDSGCWESDAHPNRQDSRLATGDSIPSTRAPSSWLDIGLTRGRRALKRQTIFELSQGAQVELKASKVEAPDILPIVARLRIRDLNPGRARRCGPDRVPMPKDMPRPGSRPEEPGLGFQKPRDGFAGLELEAGPKHH
ncbi:hypothetical protein DFH06DRAFT_1297552 [Mycena polygramma]|nr:hypothetical protein DFH06DRAFT_1297552 [Mycena polygramma]